MNRRLLVPLDGMPLAETALPLAQLLAGVLDADLELLRVLPLERDSSRQAESDAEAYLVRVQSTLDGPPPEVMTRVLHGDPGKCIVQEAKARHVGCVVMTSHARAGMRRTVLGSVADYVVAHSPAPTVLTRGDVRAAGSVRTLLVAIDATSAAPLPTVVQLAKAHDARVVLLRVIAAEDLAIWQWQRGPILDEPQLVVAARQHLDDIASRLRNDGIRAETRVLIGAAVPVIDAFAKQVNADLIVMTSHGRTGAQRAVQGSVTDAVMRTANRPVMVCRLVPPPPGKPRAADVAHAIQHPPPPLVPQTIPDPSDGVWHRHPAAAWKHLGGTPSP
jgi:nucleotide-binding universal stress UspA family protein